MRAALLAVDAIAKIDGASATKFDGVIEAQTRPVRGVRGGRELRMGGRRA